MKITPATLYLILIGVFVLYASWKMSGLSK